MHKHACTHVRKLGLSMALCKQSVNMALHLLESSRARQQHTRGCNTQL
jgi:hypothetical protein